MSRKADRKLWDSLLTGLSDSLIITLQINSTLQGRVLAGYKKKSRTSLAMSLRSNLNFYTRNKSRASLTASTMSSHNVSQVFLGILKSD
jgi:hypothetical protein